MTAALWNPVALGDIDLDHRLAMAPMTRDRSTAEGVPTAMNAEYYAQRASMALSRAGRLSATRWARPASRSRAPGVRC